MTFENLLKRQIIRCLLLGSVLFSLSAMAEKVVVVKGAKSKISVSPSRLRQISLGRSTEAEDGMPIHLYDSPEGTALYKDFYRLLTQKTPTELKAHWSYMIFTGRSVPAKTLNNGDQLIATLVEDQNAVGYLREKDVDPRVKVLFILED